MTTAYSISFDIASLFHFHRIVCKCEKLNYISSYKCKSGCAIYYTICLREVLEECVKGVRMFCNHHIKHFAIDLEGHILDIFFGSD